MNLSNEDSIETSVYDLLKTVIDPEIGISIVALGLVYKISYDSTSNIIHIEMTLTSEGCPMGDVITQEVESVIGDSFPEKTLNLKLVWAPRWTSDYITPEGRKSLDDTY